MDIDTYESCVFVFQVVGIQQYLVKPTEVDQNENTLSDQVTSDIGITEKMVKTSGIPLQDAIEKVSDENRIQVLFESSVNDEGLYFFLQIAVVPASTGYRFLLRRLHRPPRRLPSLSFYCCHSHVTRIQSHVTRVISISTKLFSF